MVLPHSIPRTGTGKGQINVVAPNGEARQLTVGFRLPEWLVAHGKPASKDGYGQG